MRAQHVIGSTSNKAQPPVVMKVTCGMAKFPPVGFTRCIWQGEMALQGDCCEGWVVRHTAKLPGNSSMYLSHYPSQQLKPLTHQNM